MAGEEDHKLPQPKVFTPQEEAKKSNLEKGAAGFAKGVGTIKALVGGALTAGEACTSALAATVVAVPSGALKMFGGAVKNYGNKINNNVIRNIGIGIKKVSSPVFDAAVPIMMHPIKTAGIAVDGVRMMQEGSIYNSSPSRPMAELYNNTVGNVNNKIDAVTNPEDVKKNQEAAQAWAESSKKFESKPIVYGEPAVAASQEQQATVTVPSKPVEAVPIDSPEKGSKTAAMAKSFSAKAGSASKSSQSTGSISPSASPNLKGGGGKGMAVQ